MAEPVAAAPPANLHRSAMRFIFFAAVIAALIAWPFYGKPLTLAHGAWIAGFIGMFAIRLPHARRNTQNVISDNRHDASEKLLLFGMWMTSMLLPFITIATPFLDFAAYTLPAWTTWIGAALLVPYLWLFWRSHADLGRNWSPGLEVRADHGLVTGGVYNAIRHPMYAAIWLGALAQPLLVHNWIGGFAILPCFLAMYLIRVPREEAMMHQRFGEAWIDYTQRTGRNIPRL
jgi:protein-S-isoprenylcysteine O-methyltransferase Ste14